MSNESPPPTKPKPGSLRDRIAAFENKNAPAASAPGPGAGVAAPVPRPKPGNLQWKPKPPSPPPTIPDQASKIAGVGGGMSASDAKESISRGGTLRERMAALQGKGGFGAPAPPPVKPVAVEKPKWKPPPVVSPSPVDDEGVPGRASSQSPPYRRRVPPRPKEIGPALDPEEEERQRRAAIAARMARLGGARIGMAPPIVAPKPVVRKPTTPAPEPKQEESNSTNHRCNAAVGTLIRELVGSPSKEETTEECTPPVERRDSDQASIGSSSSNRTPAAMPVPAGPRRAAPPRRKTYKSAPSTQLPEVPVPVSGSDQSVSEPIATASPPPLAEASSVESSQQLVVTPPVGALVAREAHHEVGIVNQPADVLDDTLLSGEDGTGTVLVERLDTIVNEPEGDVDEEGYTQELQVRGQGSLVGSSSNMTADDEHGYVPSDRTPSSHVHVELEPEQEKELEVEQGQDEDEEDDETRRKRVAARLAQMGAFNPLTGPPPIPRRTSIEEPHSEENQFDVEEEVNVDTEEVGEYVPSPPAAAAPPAAHQVEEEFERGHVTAEVEERNVEADIEKMEGEGESISDEHEVEFESTTTAGDRVTHRVLYHNTGIDDDDEEGQQHAGRLSLEERTAQAIADQLFDDSYSNGADLGEPLASTAEAELGAEGQAPASQADINSRGSVPSTRPENKPALETRANDDDDDDGYVTGAGKGEDDDMAPPRITRPIPPPPVNFGTKPLLVSPSAPSRTALQSLKDDEQDRAVSPDIPPRPIPPPPVRSGMCHWVISYLIMPSCPL
ncbi:hypothetical protein F5J12DRAFT_800532 [Pisolithus orientalis]|uniref:uncharacterized protein n=1 Tax=Pisolithus orientalis TaxID=936130 RepID=UPI002223F0EC|nr:uncharacterized protein F5J12DRAFT_800532 [Pisolithus orientalis]KAI6030455.1 hypothetical protein F5J12DRAFT_800532 [Pisolithus orientalis]